jgi:hypothetical protein
MKRVEIEMFSEATNCPVVRVPHRRFPGVVLQGDSLRNLFGMAEEVCKLAVGVPNPGLSDAAEELRDTLAEYVTAYEQTMRANGLELPY